MVSRLFPNSISTSSCAFTALHLPSANLTWHLVLVIISRGAKLYASSSLINLAVAPVTIVGLYKFPPIVTAADNYCFSSISLSVRLEGCV